MSRFILIGFVILFVGWIQMAECNPFQAFGEAVTAIIIVYLLYFLTLGHLTTTFLQTKARIRTVSYSVI